MRDLVKKKWLNFSAFVLFPIVVWGRSVRNNIEVAELYIQKTINSLRYALDEIEKICEQGHTKICESVHEEICKYSRELYKLGEFIGKFPSLWSQERIQDVKKLLDRAATANEGTKYYPNCKERADTFLDHMEKSK